MYTAQSISSSGWAAYCRVSTKQEEQLNSYETQVRYYTDRINREPGWKLAWALLPIRVSPAPV